MELAKVHEAGALRVCYAKLEDDVNIVSGGSDGKLCVLGSGKDLEEKTSIRNKDGAITSVCFTSKFGIIAFGDEKGNVKSHNLKNLTFDANMTRLVFPVRSLSFSPSGTILAVSGDAEVIKLVDVNLRDKVFRQLSPSSSARGIAYDPESTYLAVVSANGVIHIWDVAEGTCAKKIPLLARKVGSSSGLLIGLSWHPDGGSLLAVPGTDNDVVMLERLSWAEQAAARLSGVHTKPVNLVQFSPNGLYAATAGEDKVVAIWDASTHKCIGRKSLSGVVTDFKWHLEANEALLGLDSGEVGRWQDLIPSDMVGPAEQVDKDMMAQADDEDVQDEVIEDLFRDDDSMDVERPQAAKRRRVDQPVSSFSSIASHPQKPVHPGATKPPIDDKPFFLCYSLLGFIQFRNMAEHNVAQVTLNDPSLLHVRVPIFHDFNGFTMGDIGESGLVFACPSDGSNPSLINFKPFTHWASQSEWSLSLKDGEEAMCVAAGEQFVAVGTSKRMLRLFGISGVQQSVSSLEGNPVAVCARGKNLAIVFHKFGSGLANEQNLGYMVWNSDKLHVTRGGQVCLSRKSTLKWIGFSEDGMLAAYDSLGVLRIESTEFPGCWMPVFESEVQKRNEEIFWIIGVRRKVVVCIVCKPQTPEPQVHPPPVISEIPLEIPGVTVADSEVSELENSYMLLRPHHMQSLVIHGRHHPSYEECSLEIDSMLLKLFHKALKADLPVRAWEIARGLRNGNIIQGALALANHHSSGPLAERLTKLLETHMEDQQDDISEDDLGLDALAQAAASPSAFSNEGTPHHDRHETHRPFSSQGKLAESVGGISSQAGEQSMDGSKRRRRSNPFARK